jgi:tRNA1Val (adenine37-N6)-methyltransferase
VIATAEPALTTGTLLGGRVRYDQFAHGYRTGIEPVLLAAAAPAKPGERVIEAGCGAGAALLCLAHRVPDVSGLGIEQDPALAALAAANARANAMHHRLAFQTGRIEQLGRDHGRQSLFDHAMANPPWHDAAGTASPDPGRDAAKRAPKGLLTDWAIALAGCLRHRGTLSLILPAAQLDSGMTALAAALCGAIQLIPLWPRAGTAARLIILRGVRGERGAARLVPGLVLHEGPTGYSAAATEILREGGPLTAGG